MTPDEIATQNTAALREYIDDFYDALNSYLDSPNNREVWFGRLRERLNEIQTEVTNAVALIHSWGYAPNYPDGCLDRMQLYGGTMTDHFLQEIHQIGKHPEDRDRGLRRMAEVITFISDPYHMG